MARIDFEDTAKAFAGKSRDDLMKARWLFRLMGNATLVDIGSHLTRMALRLRLPVTSLVKQTIYSQFCGGETLAETVPSVRRLAEHGVSTILDYGVEAQDDEEAFEANLVEQVRAIEFADRHPEVPFVSCKITGYARFELLERVSRGADLTPQETREWSMVARRLEKICRAASERDVALYIDAEESWIQVAIDGLVEELMRRWNRAGASIYTTVQLYRHDRLAYLEEAVRSARAGGYVLGVKLVRGAYMEKERERARRLGVPSPIHEDKASVDRDYDRAVDLCLENLEHVAFCVATHNEESCRRLVERIQDKGIPADHPHLHFAQLLGMSDHISYNLAGGGMNVSKYVPYGPVRDVVPYLIRRAEENRSVAGQLGRELRLIERELARRRGVAGSS